MDRPRHGDSVTGSPHRVFGKSQEQPKTGHMHTTDDNCFLYKHCNCYSVVVLNGSTFGQVQGWPPALLLVYHVKLGRLCIGVLYGCVTIACIARRKL